VDIPTVTTARLELRGHALADLDACAAMWSDPAVVRHFGGIPISHEDCWARLQRYVGHWQLLGFGFWAVIERASGRYVGEVGFAEFHRACEPRLDSSPEGGWVLASWAHGRGFATEAVRGALAWDGGRFARQRTQCVIDPGNEASARVAAKCGYAFAHDATYRQKSVRVYARAAD